MGRVACGEKAWELPGPSSTPRSVRLSYLAITKFTPFPPKIKVDHGPNCES